MVSCLRRDPGNFRTALAQRNHTASSSHSGSDSDANPGDDAGSEDDDAATNEVTGAVPVEVNVWESDNEDDENMDDGDPWRVGMKDLNEKDLYKHGKKVALTEAGTFRWSWNKRQGPLMKKAKKRSSAGRSRHVGGEAKKAPGEVQEQIAIALINGQLHTEAKQEQEDDGDELHQFNDPADCKTHPQHKQNNCRFCFNHKAIYHFSKCRNPKERKKREEKGPKGGDKHTTTGHVRFCNHGGCCAKHACGHVKARRAKKEMAAAQARGN